MSLYNRLFGMNEETPVLLGMIGVNKEYFDRFRDVDLIKNGTIIRIFTRIGGGNRESYKRTWEKIRKHNLYLRDYDDEFDETYAYIEYKIPDTFKETATNMFKNEPLTFKERFEKELKDIGKPGTRANEVAEEISMQIIQTIEKDSGENSRRNKYNSNIKGGVYEKI